MRSRPTSRLLRPAVAAAIALGVVAAGAVTAPQAAEAAGNTYYVDNRPDADCSDAAAGTSPEVPWCTFAPTTSLTIGPGVSLLLARGASWAEPLTVSPQGSDTEPATVGAYGDGPAPRILYNESGTGVIVRNATHAVISGLDIGEQTAAGTSALSYGLMLEYTEGTDYSDVTVSDVSVHDNRQVGVFVRSTVATTLEQTVLSGLTLQGIVTTHNAHGIVVANQGSVSGVPDPVTPGNGGSSVFTDVLIDRIQQTNDDNNNPDPSEVFQQIDAGCPDSLAIINSRRVVVRNSILDGSAGCRTGSGTAAIFVGNVTDVLIANNMVINTPNTMNPDMVAIDHESQTNGVVIAGNYFADNFGGAIEYLAIHGANDYSTENVATSNVFINNGVARNIPYPGGGAIAQVGGGVATDATISDNLAYEPFGLLTAQLGGDVAGYTSTNNIAVDAPEDISQAAAQFGTAGSPWGYQVSSGSNWQALPYSDTVGRYTDGDAGVDRFTLTPGSTNAAALTWTAPSSGVISLRGYALAQSGTADAAVTLNGSSVASASVDSVGSSVIADDLAVTAGDVVRFAVAAGSDSVSWVPSVAYSSRTTSTDEAGQWTFSVADDAQGWTSNATSGTIHRGYAELTTAAGTTTIDSPDGLGLAASSTSNLRLSYYNGTTATQGRVYFTTAPGQDFTAERSVAFAVNPRGSKDIVEGFHEVTIPLAGNSTWTGDIERLRVELDSTPGTFVVDGIQLTKPADAGWEFSDAAGWTLNPDVSCGTTGTPSASPTVDVDNSSGSFAQHADLNWTGTRMQLFTVSSPRLAQVDFWTFKTGDPKACLYLRVVQITDAATKRGTTLFTGAVPASAVSTAGDWVSVFPGLDGLDTSATYGLQVYNPYSIPGAGNYGVAYSDDAAQPAAAFGEYYSASNNGVWSGPEGPRSLKFRTYTAATIAEHDSTEGYAPVTVTDGLLQGSGGYEPTLLSPADLAVDAADTRYIHIRMSNPDNNLVGYLLFITADDPVFDQPGDGAPVPDEPGGKGIVFSLVPGADFHEYVLDMSTVEGWTGTVTQLMVQPTHRSNYRIGDLASTWTGKIDYIRLDSGTPAATAG